MAEKIGEYIHKRLRARKIQDKEAAGFLVISPSTLYKKFYLDDLYISEIISFSKLLDEDIIQEFYYSKDPLKKFRDKRIKESENKLEELKVEYERQGETIKHLNDHIITQKELIASLKREIELLKSK